MSLDGKFIRENEVKEFEEGPFYDEVEKEKKFPSEEELLRELSRITASLNNDAGLSKEEIAEEQTEEPKEKNKELRTWEELEKLIEELEAEIDAIWGDEEIEGKSR